MTLEEKLLLKIKDEGLKLDKIKDTEELLVLLKHFIKAAPNSFAASHYDLAVESGYQAQKWEEFLGIPVINAHISEQLGKISEAQTRKAILDLGIATTATDISKAKTFIDIKQKEKGTTHEPFTLIAFPTELAKLDKENKRLVKLLEDVKEALEAEDTARVTHLLDKVSINA